MELKITKERVVEAAKSCPQADAVLKKLFPEAFIDDLSDMHMKRFVDGRTNSYHCFVLTGEQRKAVFKGRFGTTQNVDSYKIVLVDSNGNVNGYQDRASFLLSWKPAE